MAMPFTCTDGNGCPVQYNIVLNVMPRTVFETYFINAGCQPTIVDLSQIHGPCGNDLNWQKQDVPITGDGTPPVYLYPIQTVTENTIFVGVSASNPCCSVIVHAGPPQPIEHDISITSCEGDVVKLAGVLPAGCAEDFTATNSTILTFHCVDENGCPAIYRIHLTVTPTKICSPDAFSREPGTSLNLNQLSSDCHECEGTLLWYDENGNPVDPDIVVKSGAHTYTGKSTADPCCRVILTINGNGSFANGKMSGMGETNPSANLGLKVFPNPNSGHFSVQVSHSLNGGILAIIDMLGNTVYERKVDSSAGEKFELNDIAKGIYLVSFTSDSRKQVQKLVIQ
jgi:hypothetical protein